VIGQGQEPNDEPGSYSLPNQKTATGNWCGRRDQLEDNGISVSSYYATDIGGNPIGGLKNESAYSGFFDVGIAFDLEKIACLKGLTLTVSNYLASGQNLSADIGNFYGVQEVYTPGNYFFGVLDLALTIDKVTFEVGRLLAGDVFVTSKLSDYYLSSGINGNLESIEANILFPNYNIAAWAARITYEPSKNWKFCSGIYNANPKVEDPDLHGLYFSLNMDKGFVAISQIDYRHHQEHKNKGLPGTVSFGGYYQSSKFENLTDSTKSQWGNYGFYLLFDQMIFRGDWLDYEGPSHTRSDALFAERAKHPYHNKEITAKDRPQGLTAWGAVYVAPDKKINTQQLELAGGLLYKGLFECRPHDVTAFCVISGRFSPLLQGQGSETVLEFNHRLQFSNWFYFTPDIQYVIKPNGRSSIPNALALNIEVSVNL